MKHLKIYLGIFVMVILIVAGVYIPKLYIIVYDNNSLNQIEYLQIDINTYQYSNANSFQERLKGIASYTAANKSTDKGMNPIVLSIKDTYFDQDIIDNLQDQLNIFYKIKLLSGSQKISYEDIHIMRLCAVYPENFVETDTSGITYWNIELDYGNSYNMTVNIDTESGKIYFLKIVSKDTLAESEENMSLQRAQMWNSLMDYYEIDDKNVKFSGDALSILILLIGSNNLECVNYTGKEFDGRSYRCLGFSIFE